MPAGDVSIGMLEAAEAAVAASTARRARRARRVQLRNTMRQPSGTTMMTATIITPITRIGVQSRDG